MKVDEILSGITNKGIRIDLLHKELRAINALDYKTVDLTQEFLDKLSREYVICVYTEYHYENGVENYSHKYCWEDWIVGERGLRETAIEALSQAMYTQVDHKDRTFVCKKGDGKMWLYYYGRDCGEKIDYLFSFKKREIPDIGEEEKRELIESLKKLNEYIEPDREFIMGAFPGETIPAELFEKAVEASEILSEAGVYYFDPHCSANEFFEEIERFLKQIDKI